MSKVYILVQKIQTESAVIMYEECGILLDQTILKRKFQNNYESLIEVCIQSSSLHMVCTHDVTYVQTIE